MKRVFALVFSLLMLFLIPAALAEGVDLTPMSLDDLLKLRQSVESEINARLASDVSVIFDGAYQVGKDIKEGSYLITYMSLEKNSYLNVFIFANEDDYSRFHNNNESTSIFYEMLGEPGDNVFVTLETGTILEIQGNSDPVQIQSMKMSWAP